MNGDERGRFFEQGSSTSPRASSVCPFPPAVQKAILHREQLAKRQGTSLDHGKSRPSPPRDMNGWKDRQRNTWRVHVPKVQEGIEPHKRQGIEPAGSLLWNEREVLIRMIFVKVIGLGAMRGRRIGNPMETRRPLGLFCRRWGPVLVPLHDLTRKKPE